MRYGLSLSEVSHLNFSTVILNASHLFWVWSLCWTDFWQSSPHIFTLLDSNPKRMILNLIGCLWTIFPWQRVIRSQDMGEAIIFADCRIVYEATNNPSGLIYWTWQPYVYFGTLSAWAEFHILSLVASQYPDDSTYLSSLDHIKANHASLSMKGRISWTWKICCKRCH